MDGGELCDLRDPETFMTTPTPKNVGTVHCYVIRNTKGLSPEYRLFLKHGKRFLAASKKKMITMSQAELVGATAQKESIGKLRYGGVLCLDSAA